MWRGREFGLEKIKRTNGATLPAGSGKKTFFKALLITLGCVGLVLLGFFIAAVIHAYFI